MFCRIHVAIKCLCVICLILCFFRVFVSLIMCFIVFDLICYFRTCGFSLFFKGVVNILLFIPYAFMFDLFGCIRILFCTTYQSFLFYKYSFLVYYAVLMCVFPI